MKPDFKKWLKISRLLLITKSFFLPTLGYSKKKSLYDYGYQIDPKIKVTLENFLPKNRLTFKAIQDNKSNFKNYPEFLDFLEKSYPNFFENYVLMHHSGSLQPASLEAPRVITFGDGLVMSFSEAGSDATSKKQVELLEFDGKAFHFNEIVFDDNQVTFNQNPKVCKTCHGEPARPIWKPYDFWPNAYISSASGFVHRQEKQHYEKFKKESRNGIYAKLKHSLSLGFKDTEVFTQYLNQINNLAISQELKEHYDILKPVIPAILSGLNQCFEEFEKVEAHLKDLIPEDVLQNASQDFHFYLNDTKENSRNLVLGINELYKNIFSLEHYTNRFRNSRLSKDDYVIAYLRFFLENLGIDWSKFPMSLGKNRYATSVPMNFGLDFATALSLFAPEDYAELGAFIGRTRPVSWIRFDCETLKQESLNRLREANIQLLAKRKPKFDKKYARTVMGSCISCHSFKKESDQNPAPRIPFDEHYGLRDWISQNGLEKLRKRIYSDGPDKMPPDQELNEEQKSSLMEALRMIAQ